MRSYYSKFVQNATAERSFDEKTKYGSTVLYCTVLQYTVMSGGKSKSPKIGQPKLRITKDSSKARPSSENNMSWSRLDTSGGAHHERSVMART